MNLLESVNRFVWGIPALVMIVTVGIYLSVCTRFAQFRLLPKALRSFGSQFKTRKENNGTSPYSALCTALAATVGTGNIVGVGGAILLGGPGAVFWMWVCALLGMVIKFAEATLAVRFQVKLPNGEIVGGPMYMIRYGMGRRWRFLAVAYCLFGVVASFGVGNTTQVNAVLMSVHALATLWGSSQTASVDLMVGILLAAFTGIVLLGGAKRVGNMAQRIVPFASLCYLVLCVATVMICYRRIPTAIRMILQGAIDPKAVTGGVLGSAYTALRIGASRGTFTNEAGMGTAAIAHAGAKVKHPVDQGLMGIVEVFLDTIVICTMTAFVILCSGVPVAFGTETGELLAGSAFSAVLGKWSAVPLSLSLMAFAVATIIGWSMYGARCAQFLFGEQSWRWFVAGQMGIMVLSVFLSTNTVWLLAETMNGLMAVPNLIVLLYLSPELVKLLKYRSTKTYSGKINQ